MTLDEANALLHRMAWGNPRWKYCAMCGGESGVHRTTGMLTGRPVPPCELRPLPDVLDFTALLRGRLRRAQFSGAGICLACDGMLPMTAPGVSIDPMPHHKPGCEVGAILRGER